MSIHHHIDTLVYALHQLGLKQWVISPGSRNAPIVASIAKSNLFTLISAPDERSAAFMALGANQAGIFTAALCTSGTAVLNYYPAVAESYYAQIPLLLVTADRPADIIDQWDGQCIRQAGVFDKHIKTSYALQSNLHHTQCLPEIENLIHDLNQQWHSGDSGPIHINIPLHEPIYAGVEQPFEPLSLNITTSQETAPQMSAPSSNPSYQRILVFAGELSLAEAAVFEPLLQQDSIVLLAEKHSKLHCPILAYWENSLEELQQLPPPDLFISIGKNWVNKTLKEYIKSCKPIHWHIHTNKYVGNPFMDNVHKIHFTHASQVSNLLKIIGGSKQYYQQVADCCLQGKQHLTQRLKTDKELQAMHHIFNLPYHSIHLGNSSMVRKAGLLASNKPVYANRGTSGIDGSVATAVGFALSKPQQVHACIVGDISMLYESNALWANPYPTNLQVFIINNGGGNIFKLIKGPNTMPAGINYITTPHHKPLQHLAALHHLPHSYTLPTHAATGGITELV